MTANPSTRAEQWGSGWGRERWRLVDGWRSPPKAAGGRGSVWHCWAPRTCGRGGGLPTAPARRTGELCPTQVQARGDQRPQRTAPSQPRSLKPPSRPRRKARLLGGEKRKLVRLAEGRGEPSTGGSCVYTAQRRDPPPEGGRARPPSEHLSQGPRQVQRRGGAAGRLPRVARWGDPSGRPVGWWQPATLGRAAPRAAFCS